MLIAVSGIQVATLVVAGLAVVASVLGIFINAHFANVSEHEKWQRDLRVKIYGDCLKACHMLNKFLFDVWTTSLLDGVPFAEGRGSELFERVDSNFTVLFDAVQDVITFGARPCGEAAAHAEKMIETQLTTLLEGGDVERKRNDGHEAVGSLQRAIRESLKLDY